MKKRTTAHYQKHLLPIPHSPPMIWIGYTTRYRDGGEKFERVAMTMERELLARRPDVVVRRQAVESKREFAEAMSAIAEEGEEIEELHFIGHSGMYGVMFGTTSWPEQFSPHEWRELRIPFAAGARAWFHACRTARWFAPFFARTFGVRAYGYHWYTTISRSPDRYRWDALAGKDDPLYVISCPGRKSHGLTGSMSKHLGLARAEAMKEFDPVKVEGDETYDSVADLYDAAFDDITVREDEWEWLLRHLPSDRPLRLLDIGCGNGALLTQLADRLALAVGVDRSTGMIERARRRAGTHPHLDFQAIDGPSLPFPDASFDVVLSFMSFRYLDWDPVMNEIRRILVPGGRILIVDMAASPVRFRDVPSFIASKLKVLRARKRHPRFAEALRRLVSDPGWNTMLRYNPIRAEHEYRWYLESRHPGHHIEVLNVGYTEKLLAFDSGPLEPGSVPALTYP